MTIEAGGPRDGQIRIREVTYMKETNKGRAIVGVKTIYEQAFGGNWYPIPRVTETEELDSEI